MQGTKMNKNISTILKGILLEQIAVSNGENSVFE